MSSLVVLYLSSHYRFILLPHNEHRCLRESLLDMSKPSQAMLHAPEKRSNYPPISLLSRTTAARSLLNPIPFIVVVRRGRCSGQGSRWHVARALPRAGVGIASSRDPRAAKRTKPRGECYWWRRTRATRGWSSWSPWLRHKWQQHVVVLPRVQSSFTSELLRFSLPHALFRVNYVFLPLKMRNFMLWTSFVHSSTVHQIFAYHSSGGTGPDFRTGSHPPSQSQPGAHLVVYPDWAPLQWSIWSLTESAMVAAFWLGHGRRIMQLTGGPAMVA
jgi:hypothetical protein